MSSCFTVNDIFRRLDLSVILSQSCVSMMEKEDAVGLCVTVDDEIVGLLAIKIVGKCK